MPISLSSLGVQLSRTVKPKRSRRRGWLANPKSEHPPYLTLLHRGRSTLINGGIKKQIDYLQPTKCYIISIPVPVKFQNPGETKSVAFSLRSLNSSFYMQWAGAELQSSCRWTFFYFTTLTYLIDKPVQNNTVGVTVLLQGKMQLLQIARHGECDKLSSRFSLRISGSKLAKTGFETSITFVGEHDP